MSKETIRGIDHVGIVVADIEAATRFMIAAFGAKVINIGLAKDDQPLVGPDLDKATGSAKGARIVGVRFLRLGTGPDVELIETHADDQRPPGRSSDLGLAHLTLYADDPAAAIARFEAAGGEMLSDPIPMPFPGERGEDNIFCFGRTPWGMSIEFVNYPAEMGYEKETELRRWHRGA